MAKKKNKKKKHINKKILVILLLIVIIVGIGLFIIFNINKNNLLKDIKNSYAKSVITVKKAKLYDKNNKIIGKVSKGYKFYLKKVKITDTKKQYFNIKDTDIYLYYKDIKPTKKKNIDRDYIVFNKNIKTSKKTNFYNQEKKALSINKGINLPIEYMDDNYYYVSYLDNIFQVKKDEKVKEIDSNNTDLKESEYISVIHYETIYSNEECKVDTCISLDKFNENISTLKEKGFYTISLDRYKAFLNNNIRLKEKAILLTTSNSNDTVTKINNDNEYKVEIIKDDSGLKFNNTNKKSVKGSNKESIDRYLVKNNTSKEDYEKMINGEEIVKKIVNTSKRSEQSIPVLNYHFFYNASGGEACNENICLDTAVFRKHLDYLKENGYKTLTMDEFTKWMYNEIELPEKSVLITVDDGAFGTGKHNGNHLIPMIEEYNMHATLFLISGWWSIENYRSKNLDVQSHTFDMHQAGSCGKGQVVCATHDELLADLKKSLEIVDNNNSFCYPFYSYSDLAIQTVKEAGFKIAFAGGSRKAKRSDNKYIIPRYPIHKTTTMEQFIRMVS